MDFKQVFDLSLRYGRRYAPYALMALGTALSIDSIVKTTDVIDNSRRLEDEAINKKVELYEEEHDVEVLPESIQDGTFDLTMWEKVQACWPAWVPVIWREALSLACFYEAFNIKNRRGAAAVALAAALERERDELDRILQERLKPGEYEAYRHAQISNDLEEHLQASGKELAVGSDDALGIYYEPKTGKIFKADPRQIKQVVDELNDKYLQDGFVPLSDFFTKLKINPPEVSNYIGWQYKPGYGSIKYKTYEYYWNEKDIFITCLDLGLKLDEFVQTWY